MIKIPFSRWLLIHRFFVVELLGIPHTDHRSLGLLAEQLEHRLLLARALLIHQWLCQYWFIMLIL